MGWKRYTEVGVEEGKNNYYFTVIIYYYYTEMNVNNTIGISFHIKSLKLKIISSLKLIWNIIVMPNRLYCDPFDLGPFGQITLKGNIKYGNL